MHTEAEMTPVPPEEVLARFMAFYDMINEGSTRNGPEERHWYEYRAKHVIDSMPVHGYRIVESPK